MMMHQIVFLNLRFQNRWILKSIKKKQYLCFTISRYIYIYNPLKSQVIKDLLKKKKYKMWNTQGSTDNYGSGEINKKKIDIRLGVDQSSIKEDHCISWKTVKCFEDKAFNMIWRREIDRCQLNIGAEKGTLLHSVKRKPTHRLYLKVIYIYI